MWHSSKYLGTAVTSQNLFQEEIKSSLSSGNAFATIQSGPFCVFSSAV
jgi:hypothetical protein